MINRLSVTQKLVLSFVFVIIVGSILLSLPISHYANSPETSYLDHLFNTVSMVCVTGLSVVPVSKPYNGLGQIFSMLLMQTGGLGLVSLIAFSTYTLKNKLGLSDQDLLQSALSRDNQKDLKAYLFKVYKITFSIEALAALVIMTDFVPRFGLGHGIFNSLFLAVSAFCNAGFDILGTPTNPFPSITAYAGNPIVNVVIMFLIIAGGIGFLTWEDICINKIHFRKYHMQSKIIVVTTALLIVLPAVFFFFSDFTHLSVGKRLLASAFQAVTPRTAGFNTMDISKMTEVSKAMIIILMLVGGSPSSTAGGMKTTTFAVLILNAFATFRSQENVETFGRRIECSVIKNASTIAMMYCMLFLCGGITISVYEGLPLLECLYEAASAVGTVGLTLGITPKLHIVSQFILIILMYLGRVGGLTLIYAVLSKKKKGNARLPLEKITVG